MAKGIMIQGTMSNAGKSFIAAALCRIFRQDGYCCAPFKSQNMALNSFVTADGAEIGRAQAMQAEAAGIEPEAAMNPILLKPTTDTGSQVVLMGRPIGNMRAGEYFRRKKEFIPAIMEAYKELERKYDIIVIEGAGSPVELNLKKDDIVNMGMAKLAGVPVLLTGDIDRGGIFPQLLGTLDLLEDDERQLVKGLIVNKFRGDISLFRTGIDILEDRGKVPVIGVVPALNCDIEAEDSLDERLENKDITGVIDIAVIRLPKTSNFTDLDVFLQYEGVSVRYVSKTAELKKPDLLIIPGTKSTISDMSWLRETGLADAVKKLASNGTPIFGICGGYQLLGKTISDPEKSESGGETEGLGLLECSTVFTAEKRTVRTSGKFRDITGFFSFLSGAGFEGYEIHMGRTLSSGNVLTTTGGMYSGNIAGCYVHGIFDSAEVSEKIIRRLAEIKGVDLPIRYTDRRSYKEKQYDILAEGVRNALDMKLIYKILEKGAGI